MTCNEANRIRIDEYLSSLGFEPVKVFSSTKWYRSPLRNERTASFKIDLHLNCWYDHGEGIGGTLVDLGVIMTGHTVSSFLVELSQHGLTANYVRQEKSKIQSKWFITEVKELKHPALQSYLTSRGISIAIAKDYCKQIHYSDGVKSLFAIGFQNDTGGFELRNKTFKGCVGAKTISTLNKKTRHIDIFEGFFDFLSHRVITRSQEQNSALILNSTNQISKAIETLDFLKPDSITAHFDNDTAGTKCLSELKRRFDFVQDQSPRYFPSKDLNEYLLNVLNKQKTNSSLWQK